MNSSSRSFEHKFHGSVVIKPHGRKAKIRKPVTGRKETRDALTDTSLKAGTKTDELQSLLSLPAWQSRTGSHNTTNSAAGGEEWEDENSETDKQSRPMFNCSFYFSH